LRRNQDILFTHTALGSVNLLISLAHYDRDSSLTNMPAAKSRLT
jgi:hypothetical protein